MKTKLHILLATFSLLLFSSCINNGSSSPSLIGTWVNKSDNFQIEMRFKEDKTTSVTIFDLSERNSEQIHTVGVWAIRDKKLETSYKEKYTRVRTDEYIVNTDKEDINIHSVVDYLLGNYTLKLQGKDRSIVFTKRVKSVRNDTKEEIDDVLLSQRE